MGWLKKAWKVITEPIRRAKIDLLNKKLQECAALEAEHLPIIAARREEQERLRKILDGVFVREAERVLARSIEPLRIEIDGLRRELVSAPPLLVADALDEIEFNSMQLDKVRKEGQVVETTDRMGHALAVSEWDRASILAYDDFLRWQRAELGKLCQTQLSPKDLEKRIGEIRSAKSPELKRLRQQRETREDNWQELTA